MKKTSSSIALESIANLGMISIIIAILCATFYVQLVWRELPCPLCLMQRVGYIGMAFGFLLNFRFGIKPVHYTVVLLSGLFAAAVSMRQIVLHILPGTGAYGSPMFGYHLYTLSFIGTALIILVTSVLLGSDRQYIIRENNKLMKAVTQLLFIVLAAILVCEVLTVYSICGFGACPDNPTSL